MNEAKDREILSLNLSLQNAEKAARDANVAKETAEKAKEEAEKAKEEAEGGKEEAEKAKEEAEKELAKFRFQADKTECDGGKKDEEGNNRNCNPASTLSNQNIYPSPVKEVTVGNMGQKTAKLNETKGKL